MTPIHHLSDENPENEKQARRLNAEVQPMADAEQESNITRLQMAEFPGFLMNLGNVDDTVQRVNGVLVIDAKAICDSMNGASGPQAMEEKGTAIEIMGVQEGMKRQNAILRWCHGQAQPQRWTNPRKRQKKN